MSVVKNIKKETNRTALKKAERRNLENAGYTLTSIAAPHKGVDRNQKKAISKKSRKRGFRKSLKNLVIFEEKD